MGRHLYCKWKVHHSFWKNFCCSVHGSSFKGSSVRFPVFWLAKVEIIPKVKSNMVFGHFFAPYLQRCNRNNTNEKQRNKFWREKMFRKPCLKLLRWFLILGTNKWLRIEVLQSYFGHSQYSQRCPHNADLKMRKINKNLKARLWKRTWAPCSNWKKSISAKTPGAQFTLKVSANQRFGTCASLLVVYTCFTFGNLSTDNHVKDGRPEAVRPWCSFYHDPLRH